MSGAVREDLDIAVVGMAGRFPGAADIGQYWQNLLTGVDSVSRFDRDELLAAGHSAERIDSPAFVAANGVLADAGSFDAEFFGCSPAEAAVMDPQSRLMLECVWLALENAGMDTQRRGRDVGVFLGARSTVAWTMQAMLSAHAANVGGFMASQLANKDAMSTLISWKLGLQGPSLTLQTACSTSLVGVHLAVQSLINGECGWAVAGGASLLLPQANGHTYQEGMLFSRDGTTRAFDADATGSVFGSGLGAVVLRRAGDALRDGDPIWAIIKGSAVSNDGARKVGYTAPSAAGQSAAVRTAWQLAELEPHRADYIECHGTATALGDSIEVAALRDVFGKGNASPSSCALGAVKGNIGHLDSAAGIAGFIKAVLALHHGIIPPTLHFARPNPALDFDSTPFYVNSHAVPWPERDSAPRVAAVSSFGVGGTNAHLVLQSAESSARIAAERLAEPRLMVFSARSQQGLQAQLERMRSWLLQRPAVDPAALATTLARRPALTTRVAFAAQSAAQLCLAITAYLRAPTEDIALVLQNSCSHLPEADAEALAAAAGPWLDGAATRAGDSLYGDTGTALAMDLPGCRFETRDYGLAHVDEAAWQTIAKVLNGEGVQEPSSRDSEGWLAPYWRRFRLPALRQDSIGDGLVLIDPSLVDAFPLDGHKGLQVEVIAPTDPEQLDGALRRLPSQPSPGAAVVQVSLLVPPTLAGGGVQALDALTVLARRIAALPTPARPVHVNLVTVIAPASSDFQARTQAALTWALLQALALVLPQETPGLTCTLIGVQGPDASWTGSALAPLLRDPRPGPIRLDREGAAVADVRRLPSHVRSSLPSTLIAKTFVITGASGRVGRAMARTIASRYGGKLALLTRRSAKSEELLALKEELVALGAADVRLCSVSLHDLSEMRACLQSVEQRMGSIHMVLHAAGVVDGDSFATLQQLSGAHLHEQLQAKAVPATVLAQIAEERAIAHCVMVSSMSAFFGGIAHAAYTAANAFLDEWCRLANQAHIGTQWTCVNWDTIHFDDTASSPRPGGWAQDEIALRGEHFPALFEESLIAHPDEAHLIASAGQFMRRMHDWGGHAADPLASPAALNTPLTLRARPERLSSPYVAPRDDTEAALVQIWEAILGVSGIGVEDSFVELGGNSLRTVVMAERVHVRLGVRIALQTFVAEPTIAAIVQGMHTSASAAEEREDLAHIDPLAPIPASEDQEMIHVYQTTYADGTYNMPVAFRCPAGLPMERLISALHALLDRHVALRCTLQRNDDALLMLPQQQREMPMDLQPEGLGEHASLLAMQRFAAQPFALDRELPIRAMLLPSADHTQGHRVIVVVHHIVCDAVSLAILSSDLMALLQGQPLEPRPYDFAHARKRLQQPASARDDAREYWRANLLPLPPALELGGSDTRSAPTTGRGCTVRQMLSVDASVQLRELCEELRVPPFVVFMTAFSVWLSRVTCSDAFLLGVPVAGRMTLEEARVVGYLVNIVPVRIETQRAAGFAENALGVKAQWADSMPYHHYPISALVDDLRAEPYCRRRRGRHPLFDAAFNFLPRELSSASEAATGGFQRIELEAGSAKFDLELEVAEHGETFECTFQLREGILATLGEAAALGEFVSLLEEVCADPDTELSSLFDSSRISASVSTVDTEFNF